MAWYDYLPPVMAAKAGKKIVDGLTGSDAPPPEAYHSDTSQTEEDRRRAQGLYETFLSERGRSPGDIRDVAPVAEGYQGDVPMPEIGPAHQFDAASAAPAERVQLNGVSRGVTTRDVTAPGLGPMFEAHTSDAAEQQIRGLQAGDYLGQLGAAARGEGPSVAQSMFDSARGDIVSGALGTAAQARGNDAAAARRDAIFAIGDQTRKMALDKATLRAGEITDARAAYGAGLQTVRGQDLAGRAETGTNLRFNAGEGNRMSEADRERRLQADTGNADRRLEGDTFSAGAQNDRDVAVANVGAQNADRVVNVNDANAARQQDAAAANAAARNTRDTLATNTAVEVGTGNRDARQGVAARTSDRALDADKSNQSGDVSRRGQNISQAAGERSDALAAQGQVIQTGQHGVETQQGDRRITQKDEEAHAAKPDFFDRLGQMATTGAAVATIASDERAKKGIAPTSPAALDRFIDALGKAYDFDYKDQADGKGRKHGLMAQDLDDTEIGKDIVEPEASGKKVINTTEFLTALGAAVGRLNQKIEEMR